VIELETLPANTGQLLNYSTGNIISYIAYSGITSKNNQGKEIQQKL